MMPEDEAIAAAIRNLPNLEPPDGWQERAMARWDLERARDRHRRRVIVVAVVVTLVVAWSVVASTLGWL